MNFRKVRKSIRLKPEKLEDFEIKIYNPQGKYRGFLGDISETGMIALFPQGKIEQIFFPKGKVIEGSFMYLKEKIQIEFKGEVRWIRKTEINDKKFFCLGIDFNTGFILPPIFYSLKISENDHYN